MRWKPPGASVTVAPGGISRPLSTSRMRMMLPSIFISWTCTVPAAGLLADTSRSGVVPVLVTVRKPPPAGAVGGVARAQGWPISSAPSL